MVSVLCLLWLGWRIIRAWVGTVSDMSAVSDADRRKYGGGEREGHRRGAVEVSASVQSASVSASSSGQRTVDVEGGVKDDVSGVLVEPCDEHEDGWRATRKGEVVEDCVRCER